MAKRKQLKCDKTSAKMQPQGLLNQCQHVGCETKTSAQFCIAHSLEIGRLAQPPQPVARRKRGNGKTGNRLFAW